ncbi:MAG: tetratricopeptide repeat protein [Candidatus Sericytochromatia bacterium]|nr:tetratricopeptide repeat protein [Candidatus Sericytochromatia bacterium]
MSDRSTYQNLTFYPLKVQTLAEAAPQNQYQLENLRQRNLDTPDWSLEQLWLVAADYHARGQLLMALPYYHRLLEWSEHDRPVHGEAMGAVGHVMLLMNKPEDARPTLERALSLAPGLVREHFFLARCYQYQQQDQRMADSLETFLAAYTPADMLAAEAVSMLAQTYDRLNQPDKARQTFAEAAARLQSWGFALQAQQYQPLLPSAHAAPDATPLDLAQRPHFLGPELQEWYPYRRMYSAQDLLLDLQAAAAPLQAAVAHSFKMHPSIQSGQQDPQRRIVIVGDFSLGETSLYQDLVIELARRRGITVICAGGVPPLFRQEEWMSLYPCANSLPHLRDAVLSQRPDLLIYAGLGPRSAQLYALASQQLASTQAVLGAYPLSSGLESMQYFLSYDWLEAPEADAHYSESLVRLAGMPLRNVDLPEYFHARTDFNLPLDRRTYLCPVSPAVHHRDFAQVLAELLTEDPDGQILMPGYNSPLLDKAYFDAFRSQHGALIERLFFLPPLDEKGLLSLVREADVLLDPIHAGITHPSWRLLKLGTPLVTWAAPWARGRYASGLYQQLGLSESIAPELSAYASTALDVALADHKAAYREAAQHASVLFAFEACLDALEAFIDRVLK